MPGVVSDLNGEALVAQAYERVKAELGALKPAQLLQVNLDIASALATVLGLLPKLNALRAQLQALPDFDLVTFDRLEDYALALTFVQAGYQMATEPADQLAELFAEASRMRAMLLADARALAKRGLLDPEQLTRLKGRSGYGNVAQDLQALCMALENRFAQIEGKSGITRAELQAASRIALQLTRVVGLRAHAPKQARAAAELRQRAFTLLLLTYEGARAAVQYLRARHGDADTIAPSLYPGRPRRRPARAVQGATSAHAADSTAGSMRSLDDHAASGPFVSPAAAGAADQRGSEASEASEHPFLS